MWISRWIYVVVGYITLLSLKYAACSNGFVSQPKLEPYLVRPGDLDLVLPCAVEPQYAQSPPFSLYWLSTANGQPRLVAHGDQAKTSGYELYTGPDCSSRGSTTTGEGVGDSPRLRRGSTDADPRASNGVPSTGCYNLRIKQVAFDRDNGVFVCQIQKPDGTLESSNPARVVVLVAPGPPIITVQPAGPVRENQLVEMECRTQGGNPAPSIVWQFANGSSVNALNVKQETTSDGSRSTIGSVKFLATPLENGAVVVCRVRNEALAKEGTLDVASNPLNIIYSPRVSVGPGSPYNVEEGSSASMTCSADSNPPPNNLSWSFNDDPWPGSQGKLSLNFTAHRTNTGVYHCEAGSLGGQGRGRIKLNVLYAPEITLNSEYRGAVRKSVVLACAVDAVPPASKISWSGPNGHSSDNSTLELKMLTLKDMGNYTCQASNEMNLFGFGPVTRLSHKSTTLVIDHAPGQAIITLQGKPVVVGSEANLTCRADDLGSPPASYRWLTPSQVNFDPDAIPRQFLIVPSAKLADSGKYSCQPFNDIGTGEIGSYYLTVYVPAQIDRGPSTFNESKNEGDQGYSLTCSAIGHPAPNISWSKDGDTIDPQNPPMDDGHWSISQTIDPSHCENNETCMFRVVGVLQWQTAIRWSDKGSYGCWAFNGAGQPASVNSSLSVLHRPVIVNDPSRPFVAVDLSRAAVLTCRANARPEPRLKWSRDGQDLTGAANNSGEYTVEQRRLNPLEDLYESSLAIGVVKEQNMGEYVCLAENQLGQTNFRFTLQAKTKPLIPSMLRLVEKTHLSAVLAWRSGFDGGEPQTFAVETSHSTNGQIRLENVSESSQSIFSQNLRIKRFVGIEKPAEIFYNVTNLLPASEYKFRLRAANRLGDTEWTPLVAASTMDAPLDAEIPKASEGAYNGENMVLTFKPTTLDSASYCLLVYRQLTSGKFVVQNCFATNSGQVEHLKPSNNFKIRFCQRQNFSCGAELDVFTGADSPLTWQLLLAVGASFFLLLAAVVALGAYCYHSRRSANADGNKKMSTSPSPLSTTSSIVGAAVVNNHPQRRGNDLSGGGGRHAPSPDGNAPNGVVGQSASRDSGLYTRDGASSAASSRQQQQQRRLSTDDADSTLTVPVADMVANAALAPTKNRRTASSNKPQASAKPSLTNDEPSLNSVAASINRPPSYDAHEHWGATDGYGLTNGHGSANNGSYGFAQLLGGRGTVNDQSRADDLKMGVVSPSSPFFDSSTRRPESADDQSDFSTTNGGRRVLKEIIV